MAFRINQTSIAKKKMLRYLNQDEMLPDITRVPGMNSVVVAIRQAVIVSL